LLNAEPPTRHGGTLPARGEGWEHAALLGFIPPLDGEVGALSAPGGVKQKDSDELNGLALAVVDEAHEHIDTADGHAVRRLRQAFDADRSHLDVHESARILAEEVVVV
jgi:hypothetical protein